MTRRASIYILLFCLILVFPVHAKTVREFWLTMPDSVLHYLDKSKRTEMVDYVDMQVKASAKNVLKGESVIDTLTNEYAKITLNCSSELQIRRLWNTSGDSLFCVLKTLKGPLEDSEIALYTQDWVKTDDVKIDVSSLVAKPDSMNEETFRELSSLMDVKLVGAQLMLDEDALVVNLSVPMLTKEESERLKAVLLQRKLKWNGQNFK